MTYEITFARSEESGRLACKRIVGKDDGTFSEFGYDKVSYWKFASVRRESNAEMAALLGELAVYHNVMAMMGAPRPGLNLRHAHFRRWADPDPTANTLIAVARSWFPVDVDSYGMPEPYGRAEHLPDAAACIRDDALGEAFAGVESVVVPSSKTGLVGDDTARLRLFFLLDMPHPLADLRRWALGAQAIGLPVDPALFQAGHPIYTARPRFEGCARDPVPARLHAFVLPAIPAAGDRVTLDVHQFDQRVAEIDLRISASIGRHGTDWQAFLADTLGGTNSFFKPLSQALGIAARSGASEAEIVGHVAELMAERADAGRQRHYGDRWVADTVRRFRQRDLRADQQTRAYLQELFGKAYMHAV